MKTISGIKLPRTCLLTTMEESAALVNIRGMIELDLLTVEVD
jgi:hypothetical protein